MAKKYFLPTDDQGKATWLLNFASKLGVHGPTLGIDPVQVTGIQDDAAFFSYVLNSNQLFKDDTQGRTAYKNALRDGPEGASLGPYPAAPAPAAPPLTVNGGIFVRATNMAQVAKNSPGYTEAIGQDLGIIGAETTLDPATWKPILEVELMAGKPLVKWTKGQADGILIYVDRGTGAGFVFLVQDSHPDYLDTFPLPAAGQTAVWKYKAIYILDDEQVGLWSDELEVTVKGSV